MVEIKKFLGEHPEYAGSCEFNLVLISNPKSLTEVSHCHGPVQSLIHIGILVKQRHPQYMPKILQLLLHHRQQRSELNHSSREQQSHHCHLTTILSMMTTPPPRKSTPVIQNRIIMVAVLSPMSAFLSREGASGVGLGNFLEVGRVDGNLKPMNSTWFHKADLLFVDSPAITGYNYVEDTS